MSSQFGLTSTVRPTLDRSEGSDAGRELFERRIEDWVVCNIDRGLCEVASELGRNDESDTSASASRMLGLLKPLSKPSETSAARFRRIQVRSSRGIARVRLIDKLLVREPVLEELGAELENLVAAGNTRLVLSLETVERMTSQFFVLLAALGRTCASDGGRLRLCRVPPEIADVIRLLELGEIGDVFEDESSALEAPWPLAAARPLPVSLLHTIASEMKMTMNSGERTIPGETAAELTESESTDEERAQPGVSLVVRSGRARGRVIRVHRWPYRIGRDPSCQFRPMSGLVSRNQFELSACDGRIFVRDLGSRNGTLVNNQVLRSAEREIEHGDVIDIGALSFRIKIRRAETEPEGSSSDERIGRWLAEMEGAIGSGDDAATIEIDDAIGLVEPSRCETPAAKAIHGVDETGALRYEVIEGVTVLTLLSSEYEDEAALSDLRAGLQRVSSRADLPRTMVVSLSRVGEVSSRAIGVLVAHQLRLEQAGGGLRIAEAAPHIMAKLAKIHMTLLIETFHSLDEAVIKSWD